MTSSRRIFAFLVLIDLVKAQCYGDLTITSNNGASQVASCSTYVGNITISPEVSGEINFDGTSNIVGQLECFSASGLTKISADTLVNITNGLYLNNLTGLSNLSFPSLQAVGSLDLEDLPVLSSLGFNASISDLFSIWNTGLDDLAGIDTPNASMFTVYKNPNLKSVNIQNLVHAQWLTISGSSQGFEVNLPSLQTAGLLQFFGIALLSIPLLTDTKQGLDLADSQIQVVSAPKMTASGGISASNCSILHDISFPALTSVVDGDLDFRYNANLTNVRFDALQTLGGHLYLDGRLESVQFPSLTNVSGDVEIHTTSSNSSICDFFNHLHEKQIVHGNVTCVIGGVDDKPSNASIGTPTSTGGVASPSSTDSSQPASQSRHDGDLSGGAVAGVVIGTIAGMVTVTILVIFVLRRYW